MSCNFFTLKMCWLKPVCEGNPRKIRGLTHHKVFILWIDLLCSKLSRNVKLHLFIATRKKKCENRFTTKFILGNLFHIWIASLLDTSKIVQQWILRHLAKVLPHFGNHTILYSTIILVNLKGWDSFCCILTSRLKFKYFAIGKSVKVITTLSVRIIFFSEAF